MKPSQHLSAAFSAVHGAESAGRTLPLSSSDLIGPGLESMRKACGLLLSNQHADGYWCGELEGDTILESEFILLLAFLERERSEVAQKAARYILQEQLPSGGWAMYPGGVIDIHGSVKAYFALKLTGHDANAEYMQRARQTILDAGGADCVNSFTRYFLAMLGQIQYKHCPAVSPEAMLLPLWFPINIYRVSAWSRTILVPLSIVWAQQPVRRLAPEMGIRELYVKDPENWPELRCVGLPSSRSPINWERVFRWLDRMQKWFEHRNIMPQRQRAVDVAKQWMIKRFVASDGLGAIFPSIVWSVVALKSLGYEDESLELRYCHEQLRGLMIEEGDTIRLQPCKSPVWDTAVSLRALARTGMKSSEAPVRRAIDWLLAKEVTRRGDWSHTVHAEPGGWFFEHHNDFYPDTDDTAMAVMALADQFSDSRLDDPDAPSGVSFIAAERALGVDEAREQVSLLDRAAVACDRARRWLLAMQNGDGGWGTFDRNNNADFLCHVPFADHNAMIDPSTPDVTARVLEMLGRLGARVDHSAVGPAVSFLKDSQESDGSWYGRWGVNYIYGTWQGLTGLRSVGVPTDDTAVVAGAQWLLSRQQSSGGWGESPESYADVSARGRGPATASQTAWALMGLMSAGLSQNTSVERGFRFLLETQQSNGSWYETAFTGTGFPRVFYLRYHMYPLHFPLMALAEWLQQPNNSD